MYRTRGAPRTPGTVPGDHTAPRPSPTAHRIVADPGGPRSAHTVTPDLRTAKLSAPSGVSAGQDPRSVRHFVLRLLRFLPPFSPGAKARGAASLWPEHHVPGGVPGAVRRRRLYGSVRITPPSRTQRPRTVLSGRHGLAFSQSGERGRELGWIAAHRPCEGNITPATRNGAPRSFHRNSPLAALRRCQDLWCSATGLE